MKWRVKRVVATVSLLVASRAVRLRESILVSIIFAIACGSTANAADIVLDKNQMPRCLPSSQKPEDSLVFYWNHNNVYSRAVYVTTINAAEFFNDGIKNCSDVKAYFDSSLGSGEDFLPGTLLPPKVSHVRTDTRPQPEQYVLDADVLSRLNQVRKGASVYHLSAEDHLRTAAIPSFTRELNRLLVQKYGIGYTAEVFKAWLLKLPGNADLKAKIEDKINAIAANGQAQLSQQLSQYRVLIAEGYMQTDKDDRLKSLIDELHALGANVSKMSFDPIGRIADNADQFYNQIKNELASPQKLILISASKGSTEVLTAISRLNAEGILASSTGKITAVVTLAGMIQGSFLVDWAEGFPQDLFVRPALGQAAAASGIQLTNLNGFFDMSTKNLAAQTLLYRPSLPDVPYFSFIGVLTGNGLARDPDIANLQASLSIPHVGVQGANDGYIEYPGTAFPREWKLRSREIVFDSSHAILDGFYNGRDMANQEQSELVLDGILQAILGEIATEGGL